MKILKIILFAFIIILFGKVSGAYRILTLYPYNGKSHFLLVNELSKGLARKGHQVDMISPFPQIEKMDNLTQIITLPNDNTDGFVNQLNFDTITKFNKDLSWMYTIGVESCKKLSHPEILNLARNPPKDPPYDLIILSTGMTECFMIISEMWKIPSVFVWTTSLYPWMHDKVGNPENIAFSPNNLINIPFENGSFLWRLYNAYFFYYIKFNYWWRTKPHDNFVKKHWPYAPSIQELERRTSLILMNTYFPINGIVPMAKNVIEIGGIHIPEIGGPKIDPNLKKWLDESKDGVIYFTFGTMFRIESFPDEKLKIFFRALEKLAPVRILIRIVKPENLKLNMPSNFYNMPWLPQQKILQHPNTKLFITHSGLLGTQESIYYGVPMLCVPLLVDQFTNAKTYSEKNIAIQVDIHTVTEEKLIDHIKDLLQNYTYRENIRRLSRLFKDRESSPIDTANYWIEYVIRYGRDSLRSPAMNLSWWQLAHLDILAAAIIGIIIIFCVINFTIKKSLNFIAVTIKRKKKIYIVKKKKRT